jgi:hypothetical protein
VGGALGRGDEVAVEWAGFKDAVGQLNRASQDFSALIKDYQRTLCYAPSAFGGFEVEGAWSAFDSAWDAELRQTGEALTELVQDLRAASAGYWGSDTRSARLLQSVPAL